MSEAVYIVALPVLSHSPVFGHPRDTRNSARPQRRLRRPHTWRQPYPGWFVRRAIQPLVLRRERSQLGQSRCEQHRDQFVRCEQHRIDALRDALHCCVVEIAQKAYTAAVI